MIKLKNILKEVGEGTATPYKFKFRNSTFEGKERNYIFTTDSNLEYEVSLTIVFQDDSKTNLYVAFKTVTGYYSDVTNKGEQFKIMATVIAIIKAGIEFLDKKGNPPVKVIEFAPEKSDDNDNRRAKFYKAYIQKQLPNAHVDSYNNHGEYRITLKEVGEGTATPYKWKKVFTKEDTVFFAFKTDQGTSYKVALENYVYEDFHENDKEYPAIEVSFGIIPSDIHNNGDYAGDMFTVSNKGEMYRVMSTIVNIIKDYIKRNDNIKAIIYEPIKKEGEKGFKRNDLYMAFIKKQIPTAKFEDNYGSVIVKI